MVINLFSLIKQKSSSLGVGGLHPFLLEAHVETWAPTHVSVQQLPCNAAATPTNTAATKLVKDLHFKKINFEKLRKLVNEVNWIKELRDFNVEKA